MVTRAKKQARKMRAAAKAPVVEQKMESPPSVEESVDLEQEAALVAKPRRRWKPRKTT